MELSDAYISEDGKYRYWLIRVWDSRLPMMAIIGVNPSTADWRKNTADDLLQLLAVRHKEDVFIPECKNGPSQTKSHVRMDAWGMVKSWAHPMTFAYEIKVARSDFLKDNKWPAYLPYCNQFSFVAPKGMIDIAEIPGDAGLLVAIGKGAGMRLHTVKKAPWRKDIVIPESLWRYVLMCRVLIERYEHRREQTQEQKLYEWRQFVAQKKESRSLGYQVSKAVQESVTQIEIEQARMIQEMRKYDNLLALCARLGVDPMTWDASRDLEARIKAQAEVFDPALISSMRSLYAMLGATLDNVQKANEEFSAEIEKTDVPIL